MDDLTQDPAFFPLIDHARILPVLERIFGESLVLGSLNARIVRPSDGEQGCTAISAPTYSTGSRR